MMRHLFFIFTLLLSFSSIAFAATEVIATVEPTTGDVNTIFKYEITVTLHGSADIGQPQLGSTTEFLMESRGKRQSMNIVNGDPSQSVAFVYQVQAKRQLPPGEYYLPKGQIEVDGKFYPIQPQRIQLEAAPKVSRRGPLDFAQVVDNLAPYEGEQLTYRSELVSSAELSDAMLEETTLPSFFREDFPEHKQVVRRVSNSRIFSVREAIYTNKSGEVEIPERGLSAKVKVQESAREKWGSFFDDVFTDVFDEFNFKPVRITAPALKLNVKPLPPKPSGVTGYTPVGVTTVKTHIDKAELRAGESAVLEVLVESEGNLKPLEFDFSKILPKNVRAYPEKAESENVLNGEKVVQRKHFQAAIIPEFGGQFELSAPSVFYFDPGLLNYQKAQGSKLTLIVSGPAPKVTAEPIAPASVEPTQAPEEITEAEQRSLPSATLLRIGLSRRCFSIFFAVFLISVLVKIWTSFEQVSAPVKRDFNKIVTELRANDWALSNILRGEIKISRPADSEAIIELIDRINFSTPELRSKSVAVLENYLRGLK
jgi:hypothetical protein